MLRSSSRARGRVARAVLVTALPASASRACATSCSAGYGASPLASRSCKVAASRYASAPPCAARRCRPSRQPRRRAAGGAPREAGARVSRHVAAAVRERVTEFLGEIADARFDDASVALRAARDNPQMMGDGWPRVLGLATAECSQHPVIMILEDLHWGDICTRASSMRLRELQDKPFLVLALARPEVEQSFPKLWSERPAGAPITAAADQGQPSVWSTKSLGSEVSPRSRGAHRRTGSREILFISGRADPRDGGRAARMRLPDSVLAMVQARLDAEGPEGKRVLRAAAVFGERFSRAGHRVAAGGRAGRRDDRRRDRAAGHARADRARGASRCGRTTSSTCSRTRWCARRPTRC